ncbi:CdaR family transcriptional regulator [Streptomyces sp. VRA16 Mangrove soil]|uniref:PucR family transcriptional regulator n=1 Tax=Streptomyces sp. VRA16 Mangrove soil TaxID=2817434 RepID=UPI001A9F8504|nr:helix-turn-helix domain-containing protein [Streptomyces sp. VRA16 Mangrove soil]MBO1329783.1 helix-turn-helix domain-containing protein [Streptomyces sp. VRA16 Mangrove soil]
MTRPLTVAELLRHGPLPATTVHGPTDLPTEITSVRIVDRVESLDTVQPGTAVVLVGHAASAAWTVEMALRKAWEQAAACVVAPAAVRADSAGDLAGRLGVPLLMVEGEPLDTAVVLASAVSRPEAGRAALTARAAQRIARAGHRPEAVLAALHDVLPRTSVALTGPSGAVLAGRASALQDTPGSAHVHVPVPDPDGGQLVTLTARSPSRTPDWAATMTEVLELAVAPLTAWAAAERLRAERSERAASALLTTLLDRPARGAEPDAGQGFVIAAAVGLGWATQGPLVAYALRPDSATTDTGPLLRAWWSRAGMAGPLVAHRDVWVAWHTLAGPDAPADAFVRAERRLTAAVAEAAVPWRLAGAVAGPLADLSALGPALDDAVAAAGVARPGTVVRADRAGPAGLLAALPRDALRRPAAVLLAPLLAADRDGALLRTLAVLLDVGGAPSVAAARLGVHRNTVTARLERLRALGCDPDDSELRLPLHLACQVLLEPDDAG